MQQPDAGSIARAVEKMAAMPPQEREAMARNALRTAQEYDFRKLTDKLLDVIEHPVAVREEE